MAEPIIVRPGVIVPIEAITMRAVRASGAGGQNVNKVSSKVELRVDIQRIEGLDEAARARLRAAAPLDADGQMLVTSQRTRDQPKNLADAREKARILIEQSLVVPRRRRKTRPTRASVERRLTEKKRRTDTKARRRSDAS
ncbi:MAG TPA: alternative ribosome rescue aminoacyl-tRNA hydrolase ArfB [Polyangiaceae bacterium]|jgi:ribosome-associated protein|nr:alternative ribosome rescue aminoacyl-tRNA hydrolase ArfB [Polyangiaceae bacterium]